MLALTIINLCAREYADVAFERVGRDPTTVIIPNGPNWLDWLNDAQRQLVLARPDAGAITSSVKLAAGTRQTLAAGEVRIIDVTRNMGADGNTPGKTIRLVDLNAKSEINRSWHLDADAGAAGIREVIYDDKKDPGTYFVSPPAANQYIELTRSKLTGDVVDPVNGLITVPDVYAGPLQAWMLFRAYSMPSVSLGNAQKAGSYFTSFHSQLGIKLQSERFWSAAAPGAQAA